MSDIIWTNVRVRLGDLIPWDRNPKSISREHAARLLKLWDKLGQFQTIAIGPEKQVYDGHQRLSVLMSAHGKDYEVDARQSSRQLTEKEREELVVAAHVGTVGQFDWDQLSSWDASSLIEWGMDGETIRDWKRDITALDTMIGVETIEHDMEGTKSGASPWDRMNGDSANGVLFQFGAITCRLTQETYDKFLEACPEQGINQFLTDVLLK